MSRSARKFEVGERYRPIVTIEKIRREVPTVISASGRRYVYDPSVTTTHRVIGSSQKQEGDD